MSEITNSDDIIDSRDVIKRIEELEAEQVEAIDEGTIDDWESQGYGIELDNLRELAGELDNLRELAGEGVDYLEDWDYGVVLIRGTYFTTYAEELADDIGAIDANATWPLSHIDWEAAAEELKQDYTELTFDGVNYWAR